MSKHRHYEMIVAKAANMDLVVFCNNYGKWEYSDFKMLTDLDSLPCFLCLPKHKEALLNVLNGCESQVRIGDGVWQTANVGDWSTEAWYMQDYIESRIKPKKVKRLIGVNVKTGQTTSAYEHDEDGNYAEDEVRLTKGGLNPDWQFIEIEVED